MPFSICKLLCNDATPHIIIGKLLMNMLNAVICRFHLGGNQVCGRISEFLFPMEWQAERAFGQALSRAQKKYYFCGLIPLDAGQKDTECRLTSAA